MYNANADHDVPAFKAVSQRWWLFYEIKKFWNCASKTACQKLSFLAGPPFKTIRMIDQEDACYASSACKCSMLCSLVFSMLSLRTPPNECDILWIDISP